MIPWWCRYDTNFHQKSQYYIFNPGKLYWYSWKIWHQWSSGLRCSLTGANWNGTWSRQRRRWLCCRTLCRECTPEHQTASIKITPWENTLSRILTKFGLIFLQNKTISDLFVENYCLPAVKPRLGHILSIGKDKPVEIIVCGCFLNGVVFVCWLVSDLCQVSSSLMSLPPEACWCLRTISGRRQ